MQGLRRNTRTVVSYFDDNSSVCSEHANLDVFSGWRVANRVAHDVLDSAEQQLGVACNGDRLNFQGDPDSASFRFQAAIFNNFGYQLIERDSLGSQPRRVSFDTSHL